uniref:RNA exonuclease 4 n=1 Tax=Globodera rostochiensis TaxID=31243 RepID=A0A914I0Y8_GLORO
MSNSIGTAIGGQNEDDNSKSAEVLLRELADLNHNAEAISIDWLAQMLGNVRECICRDEGQQQNHPIEWTTEDIKSWAKDLKQQQQARELPELLAVACRACMLANVYCPRDAQLISILLMLSPSEAGLRGHLQQIATGEGKTAIVALFVVVKALRDRVKVDVVTSSDALARRDAKDLKTFYGMFGLTVDHCTGDFSSRYKKCYAADILYGDIGSFQCDILYHEFKSRNVRGTPPRPFECIVIDEADCILVDDMKQILKLSFHIPAMEYLEGILTRYWARFERFRATSRNEDLKIFVEELEAVLTTQINGNGEENDELLVIPPHLRAFALKQIPKWMNSLKKAVQMNEDCEYVIREGVVIPVDYRNTGTQQRNSSWSHGLHQFLQLKHGLRMEPETLITSFITKPGFINRYKEIYGLSGTLGSNYEHSFLKDHYKADITLMPTYKPSQLQTMNTIIVNDRHSWLDKICENISVQVLMCKRAALIICLTNAKGGLHVIVTFMPRNSRVERQAFGRTARQGKKGTTQIILNERDTDEDLFDVNMDILAKRDKMVEQTFEKSKNEGLPKLLVKERLFKKFSTFIGEMRESTANAVGGNVEILAQIEEHWCFWLREKVEMRGAPMPSEAVLISELDAFIVEERQKVNPPPRRPPPEPVTLLTAVFVPLVDNLLSSFAPPFLGLNIFTNPCYLVLKGYGLDYGNAIAHLEKAIELDKDESGFVVPARYYMALALVKKGDYFSVEDREVRAEYQNEAAEHLKKANKLINNKLIPWLSNGVKPNGEGTAQNTALCQQIDNKVQLLRRLSAQCDNCLDFIAKCPAGHFCKFKGWIKPDPDKKLPQMEVTEFGNFGVWEFYELEYAKPPNSWAEIGLITFLGAVQIGCGVFCVSIGEPNFAEKCFEGGFNDIAEAIKATFGDTVISWDKYAIDKILTYCPLLTDGLKQLLSGKAGMSMRDLNKIEWMLHQGIKVLFGEKPEGPIQHDLGNNECFDKIKEDISRLISTGAQGMFGYGNGFAKNLVEALAKAFTNKCADELAGFADELQANAYQRNANGGGAGASNQPNANGGGAGASNRPTDNDVPKLAINCEYVGIGPSGEEDMLARVSIVDTDERTVYDKYVKPTQPIVDYRTEASGINAGDLDPGVPFAQVQSEVKMLISGNILIGHSLDKDLSVKYLGFTHPLKLIRDTAKFKLLRRGLDDPEKIPSLQELAALHLREEPIQQGEHDSILDAKIALRIYLMFREVWEKWAKVLHGSI